MGKRKLQGGRCAYCGQSMGPAEECRRTSETADHVVPVKLGGRTTRDNIVAACRDCNTRKGANVGLPRVSNGADELGPQRGLGEEPW